jgi:hypothetical protein
MASVRQRGLLAGLQEEAGKQIDLVRSEFAALRTDELLWHPSTKDWNILQCFDHLNETHSYYARRIRVAQRQPLPQTGADVPYRSSFWGRIYMNFAFNPRLSFPARVRLRPARTSALPCSRPGSTTRQPCWHGFRRERKPIFLPRALPSNAGLPSIWAMY